MISHFALRTVNDKQDTLGKAFAFASFEGDTDNVKLRRIIAKKYVIIAYG